MTVTFIVGEAGAFQRRYWIALEEETYPDGDRSNPKNSTQSLEDFISTFLTSHRRLRQIYDRQESKS